MRIEISRYAVAVTLSWVDTLSLPPWAHAIFHNISREGKIKQSPTVLYKQRRNLARADQEQAVGIEGMTDFLYRWLFPKYIHTKIYVYKILYIYMEQNIKNTTDIPPDISHTLDVQQTADFYPPLVVTSKVKTVLNVIWQYANKWDKLMQRSRQQEKSDPIKWGQSKVIWM